MKILILDDDESRHRIFNENLNYPGNFVENVYTAKECIDKLKEETWDICFLDHDLGGKVYVNSGEGTGWEVAKWLSENLDKKPDTVIIHSYNPGGASLMQNLIPGSLYIPGVWNKVS